MLTVPEVRQEMLGKLEDIIEGATLTDKAKRFLEAVREFLESEGEAE